ncbi:MAG TPA: glycosyltransferase family 4 protein [Gammaproteobacteria bacterium]|nr:glycosyltransferase family 4 protein [Gammaproteobacteria bacterium]
MKILELCMSPGLGGLELYAFRSALALSKQHQVTSVINAQGKLAERYHNYPELVTHRLNYRRSYLPLLNARKLAHLIDQKQIDVIHMHWGNDLALAALAKYFSRRKPALVYTRQMQITRSKDDFYHRFLYSQMNLMLTITRALENDARKFIRQFADRITTLYYGVAAPAKHLNAEAIKQKRAELHFSPDDFIVGLFGRLEDGKGQHLLIKAIAAAKQNNISLKALIVGHEMTPGYSTTLKKLAAELQVSDQIHYSDFVSDPQSLMQICDCVALTSYEETFGLVLPEAMRAGIVVIGSHAGGVPEIIDHETTGLLFEPRNVDSLYAQISRLYTNPSYKHELAMAGKNKADKVFNQDDHFQNLEVLLRKAQSGTLTAS